jgi:anti-anti-sigma factor
MAGTHVIKLPERFDFGSHQDFNKECEVLLGDKSVKNVVIDFTRVQYVDSSALGMLVLFHRKASPAGIATSIRGAHGAAKDVLDIANMQKIYAFE